MLQSMGLLKVGHDLVTEQQQQLPWQKTAGGERSFHPEAELHGED